ncbi:hypothetical protein LPUS_04790 [Lasallia pustulata]|uniref:Uncharacterized protein n=1 Tax=Lasallia pustulata TaxID=136370 RepID=A0A1W5CXL6_9LECA|nr:hypothetical protein LPUS_04790 [Lasallia pustulata]
MEPVTVADFNAKTSNFNDGVDTPLLNTLRSSANAQEFVARFTALENISLPTILAELNLLVAYQTSILTAGEHLNTNLTPVQTELALGHGEIHDLTIRNNTLESQNQKRSTRPHPDPSEFTAAETEDVPGLLQYFIEQMGLKMRQNTDWWDTEQDRMRYYISRVKGKAYDQLQGYVKEDGNLLFENIEEIISVLRSSFGDLDAAKTAAKTLFELKQENVDTETRRSGGS